MPLLSSSKTAGTGADESSSGTITWADPGNVTALDGAYATATMPTTATTHYLDCDNFSFSLPADATVVGIVVSIAKFCNIATVQDTACVLLKAGTPSGDSKPSPSIWETTLTYEYYGGETDLWGTTWTYANINHADFGVRFQCSSANVVTEVAKVDVVNIAVYYTTPDTADIEPHHMILTNQCMQVTVRARARMVPYQT